ncbi:MAG: NAD-dependent epimerase/dehydratase family protein [Bryobacteraceae bacterium]
MRTALIAGASGLVGGHLLDCLLATRHRVFALVRKPLDKQHPRLEQITVNFERIDRADLPVVGDVFCTLGTTIRTAGSEDAFRRVDLDYPRMLAERYAARGAGQFLLVSSVGADLKSGNFYLRTKGELEQAVSKLPIPAVHIFRPSFLEGDREQKRGAESAGIALARALQFALLGGLRKYRPVAAQTVAAAIDQAAVENKPGRCIYHYDDILRLAASRVAAPAPMVRAAGAPV